MTIQTKFDVGNHVKYFAPRLVDKKTVCDFCGSEGVAQDYLGHLVECPACEGVGHFTDEDYEWVETTGEILEIDIKWQTGGTKEIKYGLKEDNSLRYNKIDERRIVGFI